MYCVDITGQGDVSEELFINPATPKPRPGDFDLEDKPGAPHIPKGKPNPNSRVVWHFQAAKRPGKLKRGDRMNRTMSTAVVTPQGLCFVPDFSGYLHCFDAATGEQYWSYDTEASMWGSPMYADGLIYLTDENGEVCIFKASKVPPTKNEVIVRDTGSGTYSSPVLVNGVLYILSRNHLIAIKTGVQGQPLKPE